LINYVERGCFPLYVGICLSEKEYKKQMKHLGAEDVSLPFIMEGANATMHHIVRAGKEDICLVCLDGNELFNRPQTEIYGLIVHECVHVLQQLKATIGEKDMSKECEAYFVQNISQFCFMMCEKFMEKYKKPKVKK